MDELFADRYQSLSLTMEPSQYWLRQGYVTYQHELSIETALPRIGHDRVMWGSDYPHPDGLFPDSLSILAEDLSRVSPQARQMIVCDNARKLYGWL